MLQWKYILVIPNIYPLLLAAIARERTSEQVMNKSIKDFYDSFTPTLLMSVHEEYVKEILVGTKIIEYRRRFFADNFQAFVYTTGNNGGIQLFMKCTQPVRSNAETLAKIGHQIQHDDFSEIYNYFMRKNEGCIIPIIEICKIEKVPLQKLREFLPNIAIPQSYLFLDRPEKKIILQYLLNQNVLDHITNQWKKHFEEIARLTKKSTDISLF